MFEENEFYYCYSTNLFKFLKMEKKINYVCSGLHHKTLNKFWLFKRDEELNSALREYKQKSLELIG